MQATSKDRVLPRETPLTSINTQSDVYVVKYNLDGNYLMSGHTDRTVKLWNANKGTPIKVYEGVQNREVFDIAM
jgi:WD40 repeat protein